MRSQWPLTLQVTDGVTIKLEADGTWEGDADAFLAAVADLKDGENHWPVTVMFWLVANAIQRGRQDGPLPEAFLPYDERLTEDFKKFTK